MTTFNDCCFSLPLRNFDLFIYLLALANQTRIKGGKNWLDQDSGHTGLLKVKHVA
jgi:hypothetical protein